MNRQRIFFESFEQELEKDAKAKQVFQMLKGLLGEGKALAKPWLAKGKTWAEGTGAAKWFAKQPPWVQRLGRFGGLQTAAGAAMTAGELPFTKRRKIVQVLPQDQFMGG